ncbi:hypothetical protein [Puniceicoccus vermicola]|uniref:Uncharacterized protein n=1 Tax=Puniceicoccus vermicola TaxID=388746 RepID=A0A7X1E5K0_9BACT|nr:hypothetical protein [Puniceicoccus vermicola]MBC2603123.1 hypothetical protein [Puniceicoccus vermicola]
MKIVSALGLAFLFGLVGCVQFQDNMESDDYDSSISGLSKNEEQQVNDFEAAGQLNSYEAKEMDESISGSDM